MTFVQNTDHVAGAIDLLLEQFKDKTGITDIVAALVDPLNGLEQILVDLMTKRIDITASEGVQLDLLGGTIGLTRQGMSDANYRSALRLEIAVHSCEGTLNQLIALADLVTASVSTHEVHIREDWFTDVDELVPGRWSTASREFTAIAKLDGAPADQGVQVGTLTTAEATAIARALNRGRGAGINFVLLYDSTSSPALHFAFDRPPNASAGMDGITFFRVEVIGASNIENE